VFSRFVFGSDFDQEDTRRRRNQLNYLMHVLIFNMLVVIVSSLRIFVISSSHRFVLQLYLMNKASCLLIEEPLLGL